MAFLFRFSWKTCSLSFGDQFEARAKSATSRMRFCVMFDGIIFSTSSVVNNSLGDKTMADDEIVSQFIFGLMVFESKMLDVDLNIFGCLDSGKFLENLRE